MFLTTPPSPHYTSSKLLHSSDLWAFYTTLINPKTCLAFQITLPSPPVSIYCIGCFMFSHQHFVAFCSFRLNIHRDCDHFECDPFMWPSPVSTVVWHLRFASGTATHQAGLRPKLPEADRNDGWRTECCEEALWQTDGVAQSNGTHRVTQEHAFSGRHDEVGVWTERTINITDDQFQAIWPSVRTQSSPCFLD